MRLSGQQISAQLAHGKACLYALRGSLESGETLTRGEAMTLIEAAELLLVTAAALLAERRQATTAQGGDA